MIRSETNILRGGYRTIPFMRSSGLPRPHNCHCFAGVSGGGGGLGLALLGLGLSPPFRMVPSRRGILGGGFLLLILAILALLEPLNGANLDHHVTR